MIMDCATTMESSPAVESPYHLLLRAAVLIPVTHYLSGFLFIFLVFIYNFLEMHFFHDLFTGFRGQPVRLTFNPSSQLYRHVVSKCKVLHGRYISTPWLCSPHLQTGFIHFFGNAPVVKYRRQLFRTPDGGTLALDWVDTGNSSHTVDRNDRNPIMIIIPGLTSASHSPYIKNLAFKMTKYGWNVVVSNHRGLGGVPATSHRFYDGGWTADVRHVVDHFHRQCPEASLFVVGTSIGANILVKYLGEEGINVPIVGAAAICCPWDLLLCDRFIRRRLVQRLYNKALAIGLKKYAYLHEAVLSRISNWEGVTKASSVREFDDSATRVIGNFETVDTYYRRCSSCQFIGNVMVPILCISSLDDPVCPSEAIPWDECMLNSNFVLATTQHGGHLSFFEGLTANSVWWVRAVEDFFRALQSNPSIARKMKMPVSHVNSRDSLVAAAVSNEVTIHHQECINHNKTDQESTGAESKPSAEIEPTCASQEKEVKRRLDQLSRQNKKSLWLLAYIALVTTWPVVGSAIALLFSKKFIRQ